MVELKKLGITTIVDLRGNPGKVICERRQAEALGMRFIDIPIIGWSSPSDSQVAQFLKLFDDPRQTIFVHCRFGQDRTGVMVAAYRIADQTRTCIPGCVLTCANFPPTTPRNPHSPLSALLLPRRKPPEIASAFLPTGLT